MTYDTVNLKIKSLSEAEEQVLVWKAKGESIVWTNGCFDLLHLGHLKYLCDAADLGDRLIIGLNSDASVKLLKGSDRPILDEKTRSVKLASLLCTDMITVFGEPTPLQCILRLKPDILVKGGDYSTDEVVGSSEAREWGGTVRIIPFVKGASTTNIIDKIKSFQ